MIYIDSSALPIADKLSETLHKRRVLHEVRALDDVTKGTAKESLGLLCGIKTQKDASSKAVLKIAEEAVRRGIQRLIVFNQVEGKPELESQKNGRIQIVHADLKCKEFCPEFILSLLASLAAGEQGCVVEDKASVQLFQVAEKVAQSDVGVFINGPTGTGKEVISNFLHDRSHRADEKFLALNCAAIPDHMLEAMLFGHLKGAFTGAASHSKGIFRAADKGTLLLDEISEMPLSLQAKLLRMLQERAVTPVGGTESIPCDVRVLATSNRDMQIEVREGRFREDLYYRLNVFPLTTLPLADRKDDIVALSAHMLLRHQKDYGEVPFLTKRATDCLRSYEWPGNVRELENVIQRATVLSNNRIIDLDDIYLNSSPSIGKIIPSLETKTPELRA